MVFITVTECTHMLCVHVEARGCHQASSSSALPVGFRAGSLTRPWAYWFAKDDGPMSLGAHLCLPPSTGVTDLGHCTWPSYGSWSFELRSSSRHFASWAPSPIPNFGALLISDVWMKDAQLGGRFVQSPVSGHLDCFHSGFRKLCRYQDWRGSICSDI